MNTHALPTPYCTVADLAAYSGLSEANILAWVKAGTLPAVRLAGGELKVNTCDIPALDAILAPVTSVWQQRHLSKPEERRLRKHHE